MRALLIAGFVAALSGVAPIVTTGAEVQSDSSGVLHVEQAPFHAKCDGRTDDYRALQAAVDAACINQRALFVPAGGGERRVCLHSKPLVARCSLHLFGIVATSRLGVSSLRPLNFAGPDLLIESAGIAGITTGPPLVGAGASYKIDANNAVTINLRQTNTAELDGLKAFTAEGAFMLAPGRSNATIVASDGGVSANGATLPGKNTQDMTLWINDGHLIGRLRIEGAVHELGYGPVSANLMHYAALTYDGSNIALYYDGKRVASQPAAGRITQDITDDVTIGVMNQTGPEGMLVFGSDPGTLLDSIRLSDTVRYRGDAMPVPVREFTNDSHTISLVNFDDNTPAGFVVVEQGVNSNYPSRIYSVVERSKDPEGRGSPFTGGVYVHDLWFQGGLWCWECTFESRFDNLLFEYGYMGLVLAGNSNEDQINSLSVLKGGPQMRYGLLMTTANGNRVDGAQIDSSVFPLVIQSGAKSWLSDLLITPTSYSKYGVLTFSAAPSIRGLYFDEEGSAPQGFVGSLVEVSNWSPTDLSGLEIDNFATRGARPIIIDGSEQGYGLTITGGYLGDSGSLPSVTMNGTLMSPIVLNNVRRGGNGPLTNNPTQTISIGGDGSGLADIIVGGRGLGSGAAALPPSSRANDPPPVLEGCGSRANLTAGCRDRAFEARVGPGSTSCLVKFGTAFRSKPICVCNDETSASALMVRPETQSVKISNLAAGDDFMCSCTGD